MMHCQENKTATMPINSIILFYGETGIGLSRSINKKTKFILSAGYSYKHFSYLQYNYYSIYPIVFGDTGFIIRINTIFITGGYHKNGVAVLNKSITILIPTKVFHSIFVATLGSQFRFHGSNAWQPVLSLAKYRNPFICITTFNK